MFHTRVCDLFGIKYPILQSPMNFPITPTLVAAVSNAGGLGILSNNMMTKGVYWNIHKPYHRMKV